MPIYVEYVGRDRDEFYTLEDLKKTIGLNTTKASISHTTWLTGLAVKTGKAGNALGRCRRRGKIHHIS